MFVFIISCCGLPRYHWVFAVMPLLIGYTMVTGMRPSAVRAALSDYFFGRITPGGLIANLLISPCAFMLIIAGVVGYAVSFVSSALAAVFNSAAGVFTFVMVKTAEYVSRCPLANFEIRIFAVFDCRRISVLIRKRLVSRSFFLFAFNHL